MIPKISDFGLAQIFQGTHDLANTRRHTEATITFVDCVSLVFAKLEGHNGRKKMALKRGGLKFNET